jgi:LacI family transcriptional regulator
MAITIKDIAERAGVSFSTVSKALRNSPLVQEKTKRKILVAAEEMGYQPNIAARRLVSNKSWTIGVAWPSLNRATLSHLITRVNEVLEDHQYTTLLSINRMDKAIDTFARLQVDAILLFSDGNESEIQRAIKTDSIPILYYGVAHSVALPTLDVQRGRAISLAFEHLADKGHSRIAYIGGVHQRDVLQEDKIAAYQTQMRARGWSDQVIFVPKMDSHEGYLASKQLLQSSEPPTALISGSYDITRGILRAASELSIAVPEELSIVSYDLLPQFDDLEVPVTAVGVHMEDIAETIAHTLLQMIHQEETNPTLYMEPEIFVRSSTASPKR